MSEKHPVHLDDLDEGDLIEVVYLNRHDAPSRTRGKYRGLLRKQSGRWYLRKSGGKHVIYTRRIVQLYRRMGDSASV